ncbi:MAG: glycosyltransferase family 2 protein [Candidatus Goldbacteria bacterium]|nr:glycosyltransferase family 2 protein [Candidatus Goldiibacteriota bacterium]
MHKNKLSVVIITKNEEKIIGRCLDSIKWADEIIVVDSGSTDNTIAICKKYNAKVFYKKWEGYSKQKNFAISKARGQWILSLDADEIVSDELKEEIKKVIEENNDKYDGYEIRFNNFFYDKFLRYGGLYPDYHLRLFRKNKGKFNETEIHEGIILKGKKSRLKGEILHFTCATIFNHIENMNKYTELEAIQNKKNFKIPTGYTIFIKPIYNFFKNYFLKFGFLDGFHGFAFHINSSFYLFVKEIKTIEKMKIWDINFLKTLLKRAKSRK